jgi:hypothetical protein
MPALQLTPRAIADALCERLVQQFPSSAALVFERESPKGAVRVVAGANIPTAWSQRAVALRDVPLLTEALEAPERVHVRNAYTRGPVDLGQSLPVTSLEAIFVAPCRMPVPATTFSSF